MPAETKDLKVGEYYQVGKDIKGILKITQILSPRTVVYGEFMDINTGAINNRGVRVTEIEEKMPADRVYHYRRQFIKSLLDF